MTNDPENIKDSCKEKGNNPFSFIASGIAVTCMLRKKKKYFLNVRKSRPWSEVPRESPPVEALRNQSATALTGGASAQLTQLQGPQATCLFSTILGKKLWLVNRRIIFLSCRIFWATVCITSSSVNF